MTTEYRYNEGDLLRQITDYVDSTYDGHYSQNQYQATEFIIDGGHGIGFTVGNILKYAQRYGHKGTPEDWRNDLMKVIHYAIIALHVHDQEYEDYDDSELDDFDDHFPPWQVSLDDAVPLSDDDNSNFIQSEGLTLKTSLGTGDFFGTSFTDMGSATNTLTFFNNDTITNGVTITLPPLKTTLNIKD